MFQPQTFIVQFVSLGTAVYVLHLMAIQKLSFLCLKDDSNMLANWYTCAAEDINRCWKKKNRENRRWCSRCWEQYYVQKLLLQTHGNFAWRDAYLWLAARVYALSPNFLSAKIHQIFSIISVRLQWSLRKRILFNTVALGKRTKQKCSNNSKCLSQGSQA